MYDQYTAHVKDELAASCSNMSQPREAGVSIEAASTGNFHCQVPKSLPPTFHIKFNQSRYCHYLIDI